MLCALEGSGNQQLVYLKSNRKTGVDTPIDESLPYRYSWSCTETTRNLSGNGVPNHAVTDGKFATKLSEQSVSVDFSLKPSKQGSATYVKEPGYALNSVKFDPATAGTCPDSATKVGDCDLAMGRDKWKMVATPGDVSPWRFEFGVDVNDAHVQPNGAYHYHGTPVGLVEKLNPTPTSKMTLVGWAVDGFPIYANHGHSDPKSAASALVEVKSSYQKITDIPADRPKVEDFPLGHFEADWKYVEGSGDLDECNGRFGVTPEFPAGIYHYHITKTYPFVQRCVLGQAPAGSGGPGGPGGPGGFGR